MDKNTWIGLVTAAACLAFVLFNQPGENPVETLEKDTMRIHDETMVTMAEMNRIGRMLKKELPTLDSLEPRREVIRQTLFLMKHAEEGMYTWMQEYTPPADNMPADKATGYLEEQKTKIEQNQRDMQAALEAGKKLLAQ